tara:strand:- start:921 stop:1913 length:993 start_codon:yes stop_codon:yes gene_type:complete
MRTSTQSFNDFAAAVWAYLNANFDADEVQDNVSHLYGQIYSTYNPDALPAKSPLTGEKLYTALLATISNSGDRVVRVQKDHWSVMDKDALNLAYQQRKEGKINPLDDQASRARSSYLHIYPTGTTTNGNKIIPPTDRAKDNNWRLGINVKPNNIAQAVLDLCPIMDQHKDIDHFKVSAPGGARKPDSVIIYMKNDPQTYATIRDAVWDKAKDYDLQPSFSPMWNELESGFAEAAEPPVDGGSFGTYRCLVAYLCYWWLSIEEGTKPTRDDYLLWLTAVLVSFGITPTAPHKQEPLDEPPFGKEENRVFFQVMALYKGDDTKFAGAYLGNR